MTQLATVGHLPLPSPSPQPRPKRSRDDQMSTPMTQHSDSPHSQHSQPEQRRIAGSNRVQHMRHTSRTWSPNQEMSQNGVGYALPVHSDELSRLPVHPVFDADGAVPSPPQTWPTSSDTPTTTHPPPPPTTSAMADSPYSYPARATDFNPILGPESSTSFSPFAAEHYGFNNHNVNGAWPSSDVDLLGSASEAGSSLDSQTLALLSTAPNCMECV